MAGTNPNQPVLSPAAATLNRRAFASLMGRFQGPELFFQQSFTANTAPILPRNINLTRPIESLRGIWRGRVVIGTANLSPIAAEAPQTIVQRIRVTGTHRLYNQLIPIDLQGATAFAWLRLFQLRGASLIINGTKQPDLGVPLAQVGTVFGNVGTYDLEIHYDIPVTPVLPPSSRISIIPYLWYPNDWADTLQVQVFFADGTAFGTLGSATVTFSAFGSGSGSPLMSFFINYAIHGPLANSIKSAVCLRSEQIVVGGVFSAIASAQRVALLQKQKTLNLVLKTGTVLTGQSAGVQSFNTLVDNMVDRTLINLDNKPVRNNFNNFAAKEHFGRMFNTVLPGGYMGFTFVDSMTTLTYYRGDLIPGGSTFELDTDILTNNANQAGTFVQEQVYGDPGGK